MRGRLFSSGSTAPVHLVRGYSSMPDMMEDLPRIAGGVPHTSASAMTSITANSVFGGYRLGLLLNPDKVDILAGFAFDLVSGGGGEKAGLAPEAMMARVVDHADKAAERHGSGGLDQVMKVVILPEKTTHLPEGADGARVEVARNNEDLLRRVIRYWQKFSAEMTERSRHTSGRTAWHNEVLCNIDCASIAGLFCRGCPAGATKAMIAAWNDASRNPCAAALRVDSVFTG
eukprot:TRINITY_DN13234_c0_g1_i12.p1 TRINITY_DN13234_c0_g1~~TRINITY_DN13234_c0_g1_i12.p1  ORF type:complete len:230 (-),score=26.63 TRINITY_DN13234_c0_g1_i12:89-778(-)